MPKKKYVHPVHLKKLAAAYRLDVNDFASARRDQLKKLEQPMTVEQRVAAHRNVSYYDGMIADLELAILGLELTVRDWMRAGDGDEWLKELDEYAVELAVSRWKPSSAPAASPSFSDN